MSGNSGIPASTSAGEQRGRGGADGAHVGAEAIGEALAGDRGEGGVAADVSGWLVGWFGGEEGVSVEVGRGSSSPPMSRERGDSRIRSLLSLSFSLSQPPTTHRTRE